MWQEIINALLPVILTGLTALISYLGVTIKSKIVAKVDTETKKNLLETTVKYVEQVYKDIHGAEKLEMAMNKAEALFKEKGIKIGKVELEMMIEEVVNNINNGK